MALMLVLLIEMYYEVHFRDMEVWNTHQVSYRLVWAFKHQGFASENWKAIMLALLMEGIYEACR